MASRPARARGPGVTQTGMHISPASTALPMPNHMTMAALLSPCSPMRRIEIIASAQVTTPDMTISTGTRGSASAPPAQGRTISSTPERPISTARMRCQPTRSPRSGTERMVRKSGIQKPSAVLVASGRAP